MCKIKLITQLLSSR